MIDCRNVHYLILYPYVCKIMGDFMIAKYEQLIQAQIHGAHKFWSVKDIFQPSECTWIPVELNWVEWDSYGQTERKWGKLR
jgi:hypothetical protein